MGDGFRTGQDTASRLVKGETKLRLEIPTSDGSDIPGVDKRRLTSGTPRPFQMRTPSVYFSFASSLTRRRNDITTEAE